jgi:hypothetical protein
VQVRQAQVAAMASNVPRTPPIGAAPSELLRALQRIIPGAMR